MWVNFTAVELWFSQAFAYIFNREVASKDTEQCFLFWYRSRWRTMTTALVHSLDENWRFPDQQEKTATCRCLDRSLVSKLKVQA